MTTGAVIYSLCALTSLGCFVLLLRSYLAAPARLLFWSAICFALLTLNNVLLVLDKIVFLEVDMRLPRLGVGLLAVLLLLFGLVWEED
jgi:hypothetical protein